MSTYIILFVFLVFALPSFAKNFKNSYTDPQGNRWNRWVILNELDNRFFLLVVDNPANEMSQRQTSQVVVERATFVNMSPDKVLDKANYFIYLNDLKYRPSSFYQENGITKLNKTPTPLWTPVKNEWSIEDENKFADWFKKNASTTMAIGSGLEFDCADFGLLGRWVYAHDNKLPILNSLAGSGKLFGHFSESKKWSALPTNSDWKKDERFKAAMRYLFDSTYTHSVFNDLYPVKLGTEYVTPGSIILTLRSGNTGHTQVIYDVGMQSYCGAECVSVLYGNEPAREYAYKTQADIRHHALNAGGFLRWRWPQLKNGKWQFVAKAKMPGYSLEQYENADMSFDEFHAYVYEMLGFKIEPFKKAYSLAKSLYNDLNDRLVTTSQGTIFCHYQYCDPQGILFDQYSTPSKDKRFREKRDQLLRLMETLKESEKQDLLSLFKSDVFLGRNMVPVKYSDYIFNMNGISDKMSSDPSANYADRWGLQNLTNLQLSFLQVSFLMYSFNFRKDLVGNAIRICYQNGRDLSCDPNLPEIKKLSTLSFDIGMKAAHSQLLGIHQSLSYSDQARVINTIYTQRLIYGCRDSLYGYCTLEDLIYIQQPMIEKMSSDPADPYVQRMGIN